MGKCVSKDQQLKIREIDERSYIAITDEFEYYQYDDGSEDYYYGGQSESKKTKMSVRETKGTSISFGFKKNKNSAANKKLNIANNNGEKEEQQKATIISNLNVINEHNNFIIAGDNNNDNNGNTTSAATTIIQNEEKEVNRTISPARLQPAKRDQAAARSSNRFGFRQNVVRPTSSIQPRISEYSDNLNNNNTQALPNDKVLRSKSAATQRTTFAAQAAKSEQQQTDANEVNANMNVHPPTSQPPLSVILSRYTLQSTSLPRPQYPVAMKVVTAPSFPSTARGSTTARPMSSMQNKFIDTKGAKHQANLTKRGGLTRRDESLDSGIHSHDSTASDQPQMEPVAMRRSRRFEMIPIPGRHKFEIRDLSEFSENTVVVPLALPKLPTDRKEIVTNGLIRSTNSYNAESDMDMSISGDSRPTSFISTASEAESYEEEKLKLDISSSEKSSKGAISKRTYTISSSMSSQKLAFLGITGESLAAHDCSSLSTSVTTDDEMNKNTQPYGRKDIDCDEDDMSSATLTAGYSAYLSSSTSKISPSKDQKETVNDAFLKQQQACRIGSISRKELFIEVDEKFAETVEATKNLQLLDDETSPSDSLVSSTDSGSDVPMKRASEIVPIEEAREDLEDVTPELCEDLISPGSPTHASNSFSLSDGGRDFLIDDEIADQPGLLFSDKKQTGSPSHHDDYKSITTTSEATPTLRDISAHGSIKSLNKVHQLKTIQSGQSSPAVIRKVLERSGSLDTLSPCDSIASDDLMADFDIASSVDSIDSHRQLFDDLRMSSDIEAKASGATKEFDGIFRSPLKNNISRRGSNRESLTSQLPARATRLLNRRLQSSGNNNSPFSINGSESPRSLDSVQSRTSSARASLREHLKQRQQLTLQSHLMNSSNEDLLADKSFRNSMLQDVDSFKKQLVQLRRVLQESDTLNPFEMNGQFFSNLNVNGSACEAHETVPNGGAVNNKEKHDDEKNVVLTNEQLMQMEDQRHELADLRRQVVFLQSQIDDKDRTIKMQQNRMEQMEKEKVQLRDLNATAQQNMAYKTLEMANCATQTERLRPMSMGQDFTSPPEATPRMTNGTAKPQQPQPIPTITVKSSPPRSKTQISSVYTKLSSIKPTQASTFSSSASANKNSSIPTTNHSAKPMKSTKIEHPSPRSSANVIRGSESVKSPLRRSIPQLAKPPASPSTKMTKNHARSSFASPKAHLDDSNGNSATSSLSTSSSNSSLNTSSGNCIINGAPTLANRFNEIYSRGLLE